MSINWDSIEEEYKGGDFKDYAPNGTYKVKFNGVEIKPAGNNGNYIVKFKFEETDQYQFPTVDHWMSKDKTNWRIKHMKDLLTVLSGNEENAKKACELAESKGSFDYAVQGYEKAFSTLANKKPEVEIEVFPDGKYSRAEFTDRRVAMKRDSNPLAGAQELTLDQQDALDMPF
jgi:hypothetical protein